MTRLVLAAALFLLPMAPAHAQEPSVIEGIEYASPGGSPLLLDAYLPDAPGPHPAVVVLHGGGWSAGSRTEVGFEGRWFADAGLAAFVIDYRLAPEHPFPAALVDARAAVRWIRANAREFNVDPQRIGAFGGSAGGHLAAMLAVGGKGPLDRGARVRVAVSWSGVMDLESAVPSAHPSVRAPLRDMIERFTGCTGGGPCSATRRIASPLSHVDPSDAPLLIVTSENEALPSMQAEAMAEALDRSNVTHGLIEVPGSLHAEQYAETAVGNESVFLESLEFLSEWVDGVAPPSEGPRRLLDGLVLLAIVLAVFLAPRRRPHLLPVPDRGAIARIDELSQVGTPALEIRQVISAGGTPAA